MPFLYWLGDGALSPNIGRGEGVSVREMIAMIREVAGATEAWAEPVVRARGRAGDPARVVASDETLRRTLGWQAQLSVRDMVTSAWAGWTSGDASICGASSRTPEPSISVE